MKGIILAKSFNQYMVGASQRAYRCRMPKTLKRDHPIWPGDFVTFDEGSELISDVEPRTRLLQRPRISNLEQLFIVMSVSEPDFSWSLVYRYMSYAIYNWLKPILIISKCDKLDNDHPLPNAEQLRHLKVPVIYFSKYTNEGVADIKALLPGKISAFAGQSGVGKSTILNTISPDYQQTIGSYSRALGRGRHETKAVTLFPYLDGFIADTPGFSSIELEMSQKELAECFPGYEEYSIRCKFPNCLHQAEAGCEVTKHVKDGKIPKETHDTYLEILASLPFRKDNY